MTEIQPPLFADFDGDTYEPPLDQARLSAQLNSVRACVFRHYPAWLSLCEIAGHVGPAQGRPYPEASVSARLRDLRKPRFGSYTVERRRRGSGRRGLFEYRVDPASRNADP